MSTTGNPNPENAPPVARRQRRQRKLGPPPLETGLLNDRQLEEVTGIPAGSWRGWRSQGKGPPFVRLGTRGARYRWSDIKSFLDARVVNANADKRKAGGQ